MSTVDSKQLSKEPDENQNPFVDLKVPDDFAKNLSAYIKSYPSLGSAEPAIVEFGGMAENSTKSCAHFKFKNGTDKTLAFCIRRPDAPWFSVIPKVGYLEPKSERTIFCTFTGRAPTIPHDGTFMYSIYQVELSPKRAIWFNEEKTSDTRVRQFWRNHNGTCDNILHMPVCFTKKKLHTCSHRHALVVKKKAAVDDKGVGMTAEEEYDPDKHDDKSEQLPSATEEE